MLFIFQGRIEDPSEYVKTIIDVLHDGVPPPITAIHCKRILSECPFSSHSPIPGVEELLKQMKTFDPDRANNALKPLNGLLRVARISSAMGCITTLAVCKKKDLPILQNSLVEWAKPIVAAQQLKSQLASQWRAQYLDGISRVQV